MRKKNMAVFAVILAFVLVLFAAACNGQNGNEKQDEKVDYKAQYLEFIQSASTDEIEPEFAGFKLRDESKLNELRTSAAEKLHDAADDEAVRAVYKEFLHDARTIIHKEYAMFARQWQDRFELVRSSMTPAPGKEDLYAEVFLEITGKLSFDRYYNEGLTELLKVRLYAYTVDYKTTRLGNIVVAGGRELNDYDPQQIGSTFIMGVYGGEDVTYDFYSDCKVLYAEQSTEPFYTIKDVACGEKVKWIGVAGIEDYTTQSVHFMAVAKRDGAIIGYALMTADNRFDNTITVTDSALFESQPDERYLESMFFEYCYTKPMIELRRDEKSSYLYMDYEDDSVEYEIRAENASLQLAELAGARMTVSGEETSVLTLKRGQWAALLPEEGADKARVIITLKKNGSNYKRVIVVYNAVPQSQTDILFGEISVVTDF